MEIGCHLINLKTEAGRRVWMSKQLAELAIPYIIFEAIDREAVDARFAAYRDDPRRQALGRAEVGCLLSHVGVWRRIMEGPHAWGLVLEDDVHLAADFDTFLATFQADPEAMAIHKIETMGARVTVEREPVYRATKRAAHRLITNHAGTAAYIISRKVAAVLAGRYEAFRFAVDTELFDFQRQTFSTLTIYQWLPAPCVQDDVIDVDHRQGLGSVIGHDRFDVYKGPKEKEKILVAALRAFYTWAYSLLLRPRGQMRVEVKFG